jgi:hypothetical protein
MIDLIEQELTQEYGKWIASMYWDHFLTLTFEQLVSPESATVRFERGFVRHLEQTAKRRVDYVGCVERGALGERPHLHVLTHGTALLTLPQLTRGWLSGIAVAGVYDAGRGAPWYLSKGLGADATLLLRDHRQRPRA